MEIGVAEMALLVSALACFAGLAGMARNSRRDIGTDAAESATVVTKLDFIGNDLKDLKAEYRVTRDEAREARDLAERAHVRADEAYERADAAYGRAEAAHVRLDEKEE